MAQPVPATLAMQGLAMGEPAGDQSPRREECILAADEFEDMCDEEEEINFSDNGSGLDSETNKFDRIVGALEDVMVDEAFAEQRERFCRDNCHHFEEGEENKLVYTQLFARYTALVEGCIQAGLAAALPGFDMDEFLALVDAHQEELGAEVFDLLVSMADFATFKDLMLAHRAEQEEGEQRGAQGGGGGGGALLTCRPVRLLAEEQEEGEARPDLDGSLQVTSPR